MKLIDGGFFPEIQTDPTSKADLMKRLGIGSFKQKANIDVERAERENSKIANEDFAGIFLVQTPQDDNGEPVGEPVVVNQDFMFQFDDHMIHFEVHRRFALSPQYDALKESIKVVHMAHMKVHQITMQQQQQAAAEEQARLEGKLQEEEPAQT
jgi:hypothetical protein